MELPEVPSEPLPEAPEKKPGLFSPQVSLSKTRSNIFICFVSVEKNQTLKKNNNFCLYAVSVSEKDRPSKKTEREALAV